MPNTSNSKKRGPASMSDAHKAALEQGRREGRAVKAYLEALEATKPKRGRKRTAETVAKRLEKITAEIDDAPPVARLQLTQERIDLERELASMDDAPDLNELEEGFVAVAASYSERKGISYSAWRSVGVDAGVLKKANVKRTR